MPSTPDPTKPRSLRVLSGEPLTCPRCRNYLVQRLEHDIEVDVCPLCQGVWLDRNELDQLLGAAIWEVERYAVRMAEAPSIAAAARQPESKAETVAGSPPPSLSEVVSRFRHNFGRFLGRLKASQPTRIRSGQYGVENSAVGPAAPAAHAHQRLGRSDD